jgi:hypothetical protein
MKANGLRKTDPPYKKYNTSKYDLKILIIMGATAQIGL